MEKERKFLHGFIKYTKDGRIVPGSLIITRSRPKDGVWEEIVIDLCCDDFINANNQAKKAFVKFDTKGRIVPGSLVMGKEIPKPGIWKEVSINLCCTTTTADPNIVTIGSQIWAKKNAIITHFQNGDIIPYYENADDFINLTTPGRTKVQYFSCYGTWDDYPFIPAGSSVQNSCDPDDGAVYGYLYNWYAITDPRGFAPVGWHVPTINDFETLFSFVAPLRQDVGIALGSIGTVQGEDGPWMDVNSYGPWDDPPINTLAGNIFTNSTGLSLVPGGLVDLYGQYAGRGETNFGGYYWTSEEHIINPTTYATWYGIGNNGAISAVGGYFVNKLAALSVRLIKD
jgi:uncharacterized protein (TIGR02145 family)